jgi:PAS domain S-box-containing protein
VYLLKKLKEFISTYISKGCCDKTHIRNIDNECVLFSKTPNDRNTILQYLAIFNKHFIISKTDIDGKITYVNDAFLAMHGLREAQVLGKTHKIINDGFTPRETYTDLWDTITQGKVWSGRLCYKGVDRKRRFALVTIFPIRDTDGVVVEYLALRQDVTKLMELEKNIQDSQRELILTLGSVIECKSGELQGHVERVSLFSYILAEGIGLSSEKAEIIKMASPMHDVGKIGIPEEILNAPRKLTEDEIEVMKEHSIIGYLIFKNSNLDILKTAANIAYHHHEKWDGTGYPQGLSGNEISIEGRITAVADVYDALSSDRVYKKAWSVALIDEYFRKESGVSFDPEIIECYFNNKLLFNNIDIGLDN